jgi:hypothetical protein
MSDETAAPTTKKSKETEIEVVTMLDSTTEEFVGKRRLNKDTTYNPETKELISRMRFRNGETRVFKTKDIALILKFAEHGADQKFGDETSGLTDMDDAVEAVDQLMQRLEKGVSGWTQGREAGGGGLAGASVLARALQRYSNQDIKVVREYLQGLDAKTKTALRADPEVAKHIQAIEAERAARAAEKGKTAKASVDTASVLAGLRAPEAVPA